MNHFDLSLVKSCIRIAGSIVSVISLFKFDLTISLVTLSITYGVAEILGILEELFDKRKEE